MKRTLMMMVTAAAVCAAQANVVYVTPAGAGLETGEDWSNAMSLTAALAAGGELRLAGGVYTDAATFTVPANVAVYGGFTMNGDVRNLETHPTILDGEQQRVVVVKVGGADVTLDGLVITGARGASARGLLKETVGGDLFVTDCVISNNWMTGGYVHGVGAVFTAGNVVMTRCVIDGNGRYGDSYHGYGNGIYAKDVNLTINQCRFSRQNCDPVNSRGTMGSALAFIAGTLSVSDTVFEENIAASNNGGGGAVWIGQGNNAVTAHFDNCLFRANGFQIYAAYSWGGAVTVSAISGGSTVDFSQCVFIDNYAGNAWGGALYQNSGTVTLRNSIFWNNRILDSSYPGTEIYVEGTGILDADYLCLTGVSNPEVVRLPGGQYLGSHIMTNNPCFASETAPYDFHLKSEAGRWDAAIEDWVTDAVTSPCIDAGENGGAVGCGDRGLGDGCGDKPVH